MNQPSAFIVTLRTMISLAIGGACGAAENFLVSAGAHPDKIDWHQLGITAAVGALVMVFGHYMTPPTTPGKPGVG